MSVTEVILRIGSRMPNRGFQRLKVAVQMIKKMVYCADTTDLLGGVLARPIIVV